MTLNSLNAVSPIDGRYRNKIKELAPYFSEYALIKYRLFVEIEYFIFLCETPLPPLANFEESNFDKLRELYLNFSETSALEIKEIEKVTNHDVKAVEYYLKRIFELNGWSEYKEFIHFGLTSQDVNNTAIPISLKDSVNHIILPYLTKELISELENLANKWKDVPMLARTHGQAASPTRLGKEIKVFIDRLNMQVKQLKVVRFYGKFGGATGNFNAHLAAYPDIDWPEIADDFVDNKLGLTRLQHTTQIDHYDNISALLDNLKRINTILIDLCQDIWLYVSQDYFKQNIQKGEVGSSTMPHKVNPIDFENAEGNLAIANAVYEFLSRKLPVSRLQRDLTDSTVTRNLGVPFAHSLIAFKSIIKGLSKLSLNEAKLESDLEDNWAVVAEAIQTILRRENYPEPYEALKDLTRVPGRINKEKIHDFIDKLNIKESVKMELKTFTPYNYTGIN